MAQQSNSWARPVMLSTTASDRWRAIPAVINVPKDWDDLTPEWCLVAIGLGRCEEGPRFAAGKFGPTGRHSMSAIAVLLRLGNDGSCIVCAAGELIDVRAGAGMGF